MNYKAIIIDDEDMGAELLQLLLEKHCPEINIVSVCTKPELGIEMIKKKKPSIVFLDIEMPKISGFNLLEQVKDENFECIFTTAYDQYAIKAIKHNALDYLLKPIAIQDLKLAVEKAKNKIDNGYTNLSQLVTKLFDGMGLANNKFSLSINSDEKPENVSDKRRIAISALNEIIYVELGNIIRLESDSNYTNIFLVGNKKITSSKLLKDYENILSTNFFRSHKSFIVNLDYIEKYVKADGGYIVMVDNVQIPVSREKRQTLVNILAAR